MKQSGQLQPSQDTLTEFVKQAINLLITGQVSETLILSSHKINTILEERFGTSFPVDRIGRVLARIANEHEFKRLTTKIPKYELNLAKFAGFPHLKQIPRVLSD